MQQLLQTAIEAAKDASSAILGIYNTADFGIEYKSDDSPLTKADSASHAIIATALKDTGIPVLSEEDALNHSYADRRAWKFCWIVDPLDGTKEFIKRNGEFTVNIALCENGVPVLGVICTPVTDVIHFGIVGKGAFRLEKISAEDPGSFMEKSKSLPLTALPETFTIAGSRSHSSAETETYIEEQRKKYGKVDFISAGSSLKFCLLAEGKAHAYPRFAPTMEWDTAAGQAILEAAGGKMVEWPSGNSFHYNRENLRNGWFLATAKGV